MLHTRLWMGAILVVLTAGMLVVDRWLAPWFPFLFLVVVGLSLAGCVELLQLLNPNYRPRRGLCLASLTVLLAANWSTHVSAASGLLPAFPRDPWLIQMVVFAALVAAAFCNEVQDFRGNGAAIPRTAMTVFVLVYLGLLPSFLAQLRWLKGPANSDFGTMAVALTIFVPKCCDIGAYLTGRAIGRHKMTPVLSPKKTWEGAAGGLALAVAVTVGIDRLGPVAPLGGEWLPEICFGLTLGVVGMFGDLVESLIKRDGGQKDASQAVPGFGGVLDVVDSLIFAGPVAYLWFTL